MKFLGNGLVWDKEKNKPLCRFEKKGLDHGQGELETDDSRIISALIGLGYVGIGEVVAVVDPPIVPEEEAEEEGLIVENLHTETVTTETIVEKPITDDELEVLRNEGKELKIVAWHMMSPEKLKKAITDKKATV